MWYDRLQNANSVAMGLGAYQSWGYKPNPAQAVFGAVGLTGNALGAIDSIRNRPPHVSPMGNMGPCFPANTFVSARDGFKPIQYIRPNDHVWGFDLTDCEWKLRPVVEIYEHDYEGDLVAITVAGEIIEATSNHPFWVVLGEGLDLRDKPEHALEQSGITTSPGRWVNAGDLRIGDVLLLKSERQAAITQLAVRSIRTTVYNFQVEEIHTYAVGMRQVLVHNKAATNAVQPATAGTGQINYFGPGVAGPTPHFSAEVNFGGTSVHTHQFGYPQTTMAYGNTLPAPTNSVSIPLPNAAAAQAHQLALIGTNMGQYHATQNSCLTVACNIIEMGGVKISPSEVIQAMNINKLELLRAMRAAGAPGLPPNP